MLERKLCVKSLSGKNAERFFLDGYFTFFLGSNLPMLTTHMFFPIRQDPLTYFYPVMIGIVPAVHTYSRERSESPLLLNHVYYF